MTFSLNAFIRDVLEEGRREDLKQKYESLPVDEVWEWDKTPTKKYVNWVLKQLAAGKPLKAVEDLVDEFHKLSSKLKSSDINSFKTVEELEKEISANRFKTSKRQEKKLTKTSGAALIQDGTNFSMYRIDTKAAAMQYGKGTQWCITMGDANHYEQYKEENVLFYFILSKIPNISDIVKKFRNTDRDYSKIAIAVERDKNNAIVNTQWFDAEDSHMNSRINLVLDVFMDENEETIDLQLLTADAEQQPHTAEYEKKYGILNPDIFIKEVNNLPWEQEYSKRIYDYLNSQLKNETEGSDILEKVRKLAKDNLNDGFWKTVITQFDFFADGNNIVFFQPIPESIKDMPTIINQRGIKWMESSPNGGTQLHRDYYPAYVTWDGDKYYYLHGLRHNARGPAEVTEDGQKYFLEGEELTPEEWKERKKAYLNDEY